MVPYVYSQTEGYRQLQGQKNGDVGWDLQEFPPTGAWVKECIVMNAPAAIVIGPIGTLLPERFEWPILALLGAGVFFQWYVVGLWWDRRGGAIAGSAVKASRTRLILAWSGLVIAGLCCILSIAAQIFYFEDSNSFLISLTIWCGFFSIFLVGRIRRRDTPEGRTILKI
jgi:hypothetical protein